MVFNVILLLFANHLKDFLWLTDCLVIGVLIHPWNHGRTNELSFVKRALVARMWVMGIMGSHNLGPIKPADEVEDETRAACVALARDYLQVDNASDTDLAACHRLSKRADSGVIVRFKDLKQRNLWLSGAKHLKNHSDKISVSQDLPPVLRSLKTELLGKRKNLPPPQKSKSNLRYLKSWPYIELKTGTGSIIRPSATRESIATAVVGFSPLLSVPEPNT